MDIFRGGDDIEYYHTYKEYTICNESGGFYS